MYQQSLAAAMYLNYHGPSHYYALITQGYPGAGDKVRSQADVDDNRLMFHQDTFDIGLQMSTSHRTL